MKRDCDEVFPGIIIGSGDSIKNVSSCDCTQPPRVVFCASWVTLKSKIKSGAARNLTLTTSSKII